ncbi:MAG: efflux RND transporter periplasmic adaptor subunit [Bacteroidia bacterium]
MKPINKNIKTIVWVSAAIVILTAVVYFLFFKKPNMEVVTNADKIVRETLTRKVSATGTVKPILNVEVGTQVSGTISKLYVDFNDHVKVGQVIAQMDTRNLIASVKESEANLLRTDVQLKQSKRALDRASDLFNTKVIADVDMEKAKDDYQLALANYNSAKLQLERNQVSLDYATIKSPIDGVIISRKVDVGQTVAAAFATPTFYVIANDLKKMKIEASVDEADIGAVTSGQKVEFTVDAFPNDIFKGVVKQVELQPVTAQNVVTYIVEITYDNADMKLIPGMTANLDIIIAKRENVLTIPNGVFAFVITDELATRVKEMGYTIIRSEAQTKKTIWKKKEKAYVEVPIEVGYSNGIKTEIAGDVREGDEIVNSIEIKAVGKKKSGSFFLPQKDKQKKSDEASTKNN